MSDVTPCISQDIWFEILKELPVKILGKCRCVCKSWHSLISSPSFISAHLKHYTQKEANSRLLLRETCPKIRDHEQYVMFLDPSHAKGGYSSLEVCHTSICPFKKDESNFYSHFAGSVYGLLCISSVAYLGSTSRIMIWNPLIRKYINLPESTTSGNKGDHTSVLGFGYDVRKNDHKVVKISYGKPTTPLVEFFSVKEETWRVISADYLVDNSIAGVLTSQCFINGSIHWLTREIGQSVIGKCLLVYNVSEEKFEQMNLPDVVISNRTESKSDGFGVFEFHNKLAVSHCKYILWDCDYTTHCQIWAQQTYDDGSSWCRILCVLLNDNSLHIGPVQYLGKNGELLGFAKESDAKLFSYDLLSKQFTELGLCQQASTRFSGFTGSLVLLDQKTDVYELQRFVYNRSSNLLAGIPYYGEVTDLQVEDEDDPLLCVGDVHSTPITLVLAITIYDSC